MTPTDPIPNHALGKFHRDFFPEPIFDNEPEYLDLYWKAWELFWSKMRDDEGMPQTPYVDEAHSADTIWIWDTCFMVLFSKYAAQTIPGVESLNNFYVPIHDPDFISPVRIQHPDNPPLFAWVEHDNYLFTGDKTHLRDLLLEKQYLQKHFRWLQEIKPGQHLKSKVGGSARITAEGVENGYHWHGLSSGMDNTPRGGPDPDGYAKILWVDLLAQQGLSALYISRLAKEIGEKQLAEEWQKIYEHHKSLINEKYWDEIDGFYYDIDAATGEKVKVKTPATFWPLLAEMCSESQAKKLAAHLDDPKKFGGLVPLPSVARNDPAFVAPDGEYWRGGVWLPTSYMSIKALEKYGLFTEAKQAARSTLDHMLTTYQTVEPATIWEAYSPDRPHPAGYKPNKPRKFSREDFCGWSALGPISLFIENILGFHYVDADKALIKWRLDPKNGRHGIRRLRFGSVEADILTDGENNITVQTTKPFTLEINETSFALSSGENSFKMTLQSLTDDE